LPEPAPAFAPRFKPGLAPLGGLAGALPPSDWLKVDREAAVEVYSSLILFSKSCLSLQRRLRAVLEPTTARAASAHAGWSRAQSVAMWMLRFVDTAGMHLAQKGHRTPLSLKPLGLIHFPPPSFTLQ